MIQQANYQFKRQLRMQILVFYLLFINWVAAERIAECKSCFAGESVRLCSFEDHKGYFRSVELESETSKPTLFVPLVADLSSGSQEVSEGLLGMECALDYLNNHISYLRRKEWKFQNYEFLPLLADTQGDTSKGIATSMVCLSEGGLEYAVGPLSEDQHGGYAQSSTLLSMNLLSPALQDPVYSKLNDENGHPFVSRTVASMESLAQGFRAIALEYKWRNFALLCITDPTEKESQVQSVLTGFKKAFRNANDVRMVVHHLVRPSKAEMRRTLQSIKSSGNRVIYHIGSHTSKLFNQVKNQGMLAEGWLWFSEPCGKGSHWDSGSLSLSLRNRPLHYEHGTTFLDRCAANHRNVSASSNSSSLSRYTFDATVALALALARDTNQSDRNPYLMAQRIRRQTFMGASGYVSFQPSNGNREKAVYDIVKKGMDGAPSRVGIVTVYNDETGHVEWVPGKQISFSEDGGGFLTHTVLNCTESQMNVTISQCDTFGMRMVRHSLANAKDSSECTLPNDFQVTCRDNTLTGWVIFSVVCGVMICIGLICHIQSRLTRTALLEQNDVTIIMMLAGIAVTFSPVLLLFPVTQATCTLYLDSVQIGYLVLFSSLLVNTYKMFQIFVVSQRNFSLVLIPEKHLIFGIILQFLVGVIVALVEFFTIPVSTVTYFFTVQGTNLPFETCGRELSPFSVLKDFILSIVIIASMYFVYHIQQLPKQRKSFGMYRLMMTVYSACVTALVLFLIHYSRLDIYQTSRLDIATGAIGTTSTLAIFMVPRLLKLHEARKMKSQSQRNKSPPMKSDDNDGTGLDGSEMRTNELTSGSKGISTTSHEVSRETTLGMSETDIEITVA